MKRLSWMSLGIVAAMLTGCPGEDGTLPAGCDDLGTDGPAVKAAAVIEAVSRLTAQADGLASDLEDVCGDLADELGIAAPAPTGDQTQREATCGAVAAEIEAILGEAGASVTIVAEPPVCTVSVDAYASCAAECDVNVDANAEVTCSGGELSGSCSGECSGSCTVEGSASCTGECSGTCAGTCTGTCTGTCDGTCSATDANGDCVGTCDGTCSGTCSATCEGTCTGSCTADVSGSCEGTCSGSCDVEFEAPRCDGQADVMASAECEAACEAELNAEASCSEPRVTVEITGEGTDRVTALARAIQLHWPRFLGVKARIEAGARAAADVVGAAGDLGDASAQAVICLGAAADAALSAVASFEVSVSVSVEVSASASAG